MTVPRGLGPRPHGVYASVSRQTIKPAERAGPQPQTLHFKWEEKQGDGSSFKVTNIVKLDRKERKQGPEMEREVQARALQGTARPGLGPRSGGLGFRVPVG